MTSEDKKHKKWTIDYWEKIKRNIGLVSVEEQEKLRQSKIAVFGLGGLGGNVVEQLVRCGIGNIILLDNDIFELSNLNRQTCKIHDIGKYKVDIVENNIKEINPDIKIKKFYKVDENNIGNLLHEIDLGCLALDDGFASILISRESKLRNIPLIESYAIPFLFSWWFTPESIDYEKFYNINTQNLSYSELKNYSNLNSEFRQAIIRKLNQFPKIYETYNRQVGFMEGMISGNTPFSSFAPIVHLAASYLVFEIIYSGILMIKEKILAPNCSAFDYMRMIFIDKLIFED